MAEEEKVNTPEVSPETENQDTSITAPDESLGDTEKGTDEEHPTEDSKTKKEEGKIDWEKRYKDLQAEYTKTNQAKKEYEEKLSELESDPLYQQYEQARKMYKQTQESQQPDWESMSDEQRFNYLVDQRVNEIINKNIMPYITAERQEKAKNIVDSFLKEHPDVAENPKLQNEIAGYMERYNMPIGDAYKLATANYATQKAKKEALAELEEKKKANLEMPSGKSPSSPKVTKDMSFEDIFELSRQQVEGK